MNQLRRNKINDLIQDWIVPGVLVLIILVLFAVRSSIRNENRDPLFGQLIQGEQPMKVRTVPVSGDVVPHYHITWYDPVSELYYHSIEIPDH